MKRKAPSKSEPTDSVALTLKGFKPLALSLLPTEREHNLARYVYIKKHIQKNDPEASESTLFVSNVPGNFVHQDVIDVFNAFGPVASVMFADELKPGQPKPVSRCANVTFEDEAGLEAALTTDTRGVLQPFSRGAPTGLTKWLAEYKAVRPDPDQLMDSVNKFMEAFDQRQEEEKRRLAGGPIVDDEGFELVQYGTKRAKLVPTQRSPFDAPEPTPAEKRRIKKERKNQVLNFYKSQERDHKRAELALLRKRFEEDKKRIEQLRQQRKFNPF